MFGKKEKPKAPAEPADGGKKLGASLDENIRLFKQIFENDETLVLSEFTGRGLPSARFCVIYMEGMADTLLVNEHIIEPLLRYQAGRETETPDLIRECKEKILSTANTVIEKIIDKITGDVLYGDTLLLVDGCDDGLVIDTKGFKSRAVADPQSDKLNRGPREGFNETILTNISLVRRRIKSPRLKFKFRNIGALSQTKVCVSYIEGIAQQKILEELERRLAAIDIDGIMDSGYIQEFIRDAPLSPFETVGHSERPDVVAAKLLEGRIAIFVDGSPFVLTVPFIFIENMQSAEDYYSNYLFSSFNRFVRIMGTIVSGSIPAIYTAIVTFHQEMLPTPLLVSISSSKMNVPFPTVLSMIIMLLIFDTLREAGTRMPTTIGQAINIVGTLVLGQAIIEAKLVSAPVIIVTAICGINTLLNYNLIGANIIIKYTMLIAASMLGIYGFLVVVMLMVYHLVSIRSFGVPYMLNMTAAKNYNSQDIWFRVPWWSMKMRPKIISARNLIRQKTSKARGRK